MWILKLKETSSKLSCRHERQYKNWIEKKPQPEAITKFITTLELFTYTCFNHQAVLLSTEKTWEVGLHGSCVLRWLGVQERRTRIIASPRFYLTLVCECFVTQGLFETCSRLREKIVRGESQTHARFAHWQSERLGWPNAITNCSKFRLQGVYIGGAHSGPLEQNLDQKLGKSQPLQIRSGEIFLSILNCKFSVTAHSGNCIVQWFFLLFCKLWGFNSKPVWTDRFWRFLKTKKFITSIFCLTDIWCTMAQDGFWLSCVLRFAFPFLFLFSFFFFTFFFGFALCFFLLLFLVLLLTIHIVCKCWLVVVHLPNAF